MVPGLLRMKRMRHLERASLAACFAVAFAVGCGTVSVPGGGGGGSGGGAAGTSGGAGSTGGAGTPGSAGATGSAGVTGSAGATGSAGDRGGGGSGAGGNPACTTSSAGCCYTDKDCASNQECVGATCGATGPGVPFVAVAGVCKTRLTDGSKCWQSSDCSHGCTGAQVCPCGAACVVADMPGTCAP